MKTYQKVKVANCKARMGCDPELFIEKHGRVVGSEKLIPESGYVKGSRGGKIIQDGVQVELNPTPQTCRAYMGDGIKQCLMGLRDELATKGFKLAERGVVKVDEAEVKSLSEKNQMLGCGPSNNIHDSKAKVVVTDENRFLRAAGGHIHIECQNPDPKVMVPLLDLFVGNTCVLIDRDPLQKERRKMYGRAGEYRLPKHGLEYRTPSNFWLRSFPLMGFVMGLTRMALRFANYEFYEKALNPVYETPYRFLKKGEIDKWTGQECKYDNYQYATIERPIENKYPSEEAMIWLSQRLDQRQVEEAINENDFDLAVKNYALFRDFIDIFIPENPNPPESNDWFPLWPKVLPAFDYFVKKGIDHWWPEKDIIKTWSKLADGHGRNWEWFIDRVVKPEYEKTQK